MSTDTTTVYEGIDFGEGPRWHDGALWFSDFYQHTISTWTADAGRKVVLTHDGQPSGLGWLPDGRLLFVSMLDQKVMRVEDDGTVVEHADLSAIATHHCNDMVVSDSGVAYVGNFGFDLFGGGPQLTADLAIVHPDGRTEVGATGLQFPNGSVITPDGSTLIVGETMGMKYTAWDIGDDGTLSNQRVWAEMPGQLPDGCCLDADGGIWFANPMAPEVVRVEEGGEITHTLTTSQHAFACMLGGDDRRTLHVLTAPSSTPAEVEGTAAGRIETVEVDHPRAGRP